MNIDLSALSGRLPGPPLLPDIWPGEHYKLLAALMQITRPKLVIEIGTATGLSALAMKAHLSPGSRLTTFDLIPWREYPEHVLNEQDFADGQLEQIVANLCSFSTAQKYASLLRDADFLFVDAAKDGVTEAALVNVFSRIGLKQGALLLFDDIRLIPMVPTWRRISMPKIDLTSFGHWSGTGLVEYRC